MSWSLESPAESPRWRIGSRVRGEDKGGSGEGELSSHTDCALITALSWPWGMGEGTWPPPDDSTCIGTGS